MKSRTQIRFGTVEVIFYVGSLMLMAGSFGISEGSDDGGDWCSLDSGYTTITDGFGYPHSVYISVTRDGSIWMRAGRDHATLDWIYEDEKKIRFQTVLLEKEVIKVIQSLNYTDYCVLTDLDLSLTVDSGWHPSHLDIYLPKTKQEQIVIIRHNRDCVLSTNLTLTRDKQALFCDGGPKNACGRRYLPAAKYATSTAFVKSVKFDPKGEDNWSCQGSTDDDDLNSYTFQGSYYNVYVKLATCDAPKYSRVWGHEAKLRSNGDHTANMILIPDPSQTALSDDVIRGWHYFAKVISVQHALYIHVWRPTSGGAAGPAGGSGPATSSGAAGTSGGQNDDRSYTLIGQYFFRPTELRFQTIQLELHELIRIKQGDVLGLYFSKFNPLAWSSVPCAFENQRFLYVNNPGDVHVGRTIKFSQAPPGDQSCRHYSITAILSNYPNAKVVEDWLCPTARIAFSTRRVDGHQIHNPAAGENEGDPSRTHLTGHHRAPVKTNLKYTSTSSALSDGYGTLHVKCVFLIVGIFMVILTAIGIFSYCAAVR